MTQLIVFVEGKTDKEIFHSILQRLKSQNVAAPSFDWFIYTYNGTGELKETMQKVLPTIVKHYPNPRVLITRDQDSSDCIDLKRQIQSSIPNYISTPYKIRIVCRTIESWFLGDLEAISQLFPRVDSQRLQNRAKYRKVDNIHNPAETLRKLCAQQTSSPSQFKAKLAAEMPKHLDFSKNQSTSFQATFRAILELTHP